MQKPPPFSLHHFKITQLGPSPGVNNYMYCAYDGCKLPDKWTPEIRVTLGETKDLLRDKFGMGVPKSKMAKDLGAVTTLAEFKRKFPWKTLRAKLELLKENRAYLARCVMCRLINQYERATSPRGNPLKDWTNYGHAGKIAQFVEKFKMVHELLTDVRKYFKKVTVPVDPPQATTNAQNARGPPKKMSLADVVMPYNEAVNSSFTKASANISKYAIRRNQLDRLFLNGNDALVPWKERVVHGWGTAKITAEIKRRQGLHGAMNANLQRY